MVTVQSTSRGKGRIIISVLMLLLVALIVVSYLKVPVESTAPLEHHITQPTTAQPVATNSSPAPPDGERKMEKTKIIIQYGDGEGQLGIIRGSGLPPAGPEAFALGVNGSVFVADLVNERILVYSREGKLLRSIKTPGIVLNDLAVDRDGNIYVYDHTRRLISEFDVNGLLVGSLTLNPADINTRGYLHIAGQSIYFANSGNEDTIIATIQGGILKSSGISPNRSSDGVHSLTGKVYGVDVVRNQALQIRMRDESAGGDEQAFALLLPGILSAAYVGEDRSGNFYLQTERSEGNAVILEVQTFDTKGRLLATRPIPENDYALWTTKLLEIGSDGEIVQFLPQLNQAQLQVFAK